MKAVAIDHVVLRVTDLERATRFYVGVLGCAVEKKCPLLGLVHLRVGSALLDLVAVDGKLGRSGGAAPKAGGHNMDHLCIRIADFDAPSIAAELKAAGVKVGEAGTRFGSTGDGVSVYARDPDGNGLELRG